MDATNEVFVHDIVRTKAYIAAAERRLAELRRALEQPAKEASDVTRLQWDIEDQERHRAALARQLEALEAALAYRRTVEARARAGG